MKEETCIFCKIGEGTIPSYTLYEDDTFRVFLDLSPTSFGHALIIPKEHYQNLFELDDVVASKCMVLAKKIGNAMMNAFHCDGLNVLQNNGETAGQTMFHFHMHLIPRYKDDHTKIIFDQNALTEENANKILDAISAYL